MSDNTELPRGWACAPLSNLLVNDDFMCDGDWIETKDQDKNGDVRLIQLSDIGEGYFRDRSDRYLTSEKASQLRCTFLQSGDVLIARMPDPIGRACIFPPIGMSAVTAVDVCIFRTAQQLVDQRWVMHLLNSPRVRAAIESQQSGTTRKRISGSNLKALRVCIAPIAEQRRIVEKIDELFSLIEAGEQALAKARKLLERYRQSVLNAAVTDELTRTWRERHKGEIESGEALLKRILKTRREAWEKAELAKMHARGKPPTNDRWKQKYKDSHPPKTNPHFPLPHGWAWGRIDAFGTVQLGRQRAPQHHSGPYMRPYLRVANVFENRIDLSDVKQMNFTPKEYEFYQLAAGDILLNEGQSKELVGRPAIYRGDLDGACFTNTLVRFRCSDSANPTYALMVFMNYMHRGKFSEIAKITTNIAHLGADRFSELGIALPPLAEQE